MKEKIQQIRQQIEEGLASVSLRKSLFELKMKFLGKTGEITALLKGMRDLPPEERPEMGKVINSAREWAEEVFAAREEELKKAELENKYASEKIDVTMPAAFSAYGTEHPISMVRRELVDIFAGMGFEIFEGPEIEKDYYNFQALNIPADHPARDMQDTFFVTEEFLLRSQTSSGQIRVMEKKAPPIKVLSPGRVYRSDSDATHSPMFHQVEGLWLDTDISFTDLKGVYSDFLRCFFETNDLVVRFRPSYFPFTEPSVEVDMMFTSGPRKGKWLEISGAGEVHPNVVRNYGLDPEKYIGFAFGSGLERLTMLRYGVDDLRLFFEGDLRFLRQFN